jgi:hypothetical protein
MPENAQRNSRRSLTDLIVYVGYCHPSKAAVPTRSAHLFTVVTQWQQIAFCAVFAARTG